MCKSLLVYLLDYSIVICLIVPFLRQPASNNGAILKSGLGIIRSHWIWHNSIDTGSIRVPIGIP